MASNTHLPVLSEAEINVTEYQRCIGSLMYLMVCTQPDIAYSVGVLSCHVAVPGHAHIQAIKWIFCYLHGTNEYKLEFHTKNSDKTSPIAYVNSDWAGDHSDRKSISGYTVMIDGGAISWGSKKQTSMLLSTVKAEFIAASTAVKEVLWHWSFLAFLDMKLTDPTWVLIDNQGALELIRSGQINDRTKHIDTKFQHICNQEAAGDIKSEHVVTKDQLADVMTKSLGSEKYLSFREKIGVRM